MVVNPVSVTRLEPGARIRSNGARGHRIKVAVVEEREIVRCGLVASLAEDDSIEVTSATDSGAVAEDVDVAVVSDEAARRDAFPCPIVVCRADHGRLHSVASGNEVVGVLDRDTVTVAQLRATVFAAAVGLLVNPAVGDGAQPPLESRSRLVLELMAGGYTTREIAAHMCYSERTIKKLITLLQAELHTRNRAQAVAVAIRRGLI